MYALRYALDAGKMPVCWNSRHEISEGIAVCGLSPVEALGQVGASTRESPRQSSAPIPIKTTVSSASDQVEARADQSLRTLARPAMPVPIKSSPLSTLTDLPRRLLSKPTSSAPIPIKSSTSSSSASVPLGSPRRTASPLSVPIGVSPRRTAREPLWSETEMQRFWAVIEPYIKQLISGEAPMPAHDMDLWDCERDSVENIEGCLLAVQDLICGGNYSKALAGIRAIRLYFEIPENSPRKALTLLGEEDELAVFKHLFMKQDPVRKRLLDDSQRPHSF
ncbi:Hypp7446 [Branchiostoma lanceolatum]|uniref:Hypp7446 protein n=1 Tax=Branchiostoma lanceolatum TaxID=7740 RepID=A0A8K0E9C0_BRALA|nr:Hypp7446 [Branchiostoma lanceolatum]